MSPAPKILPSSAYQTSSTPIRTSTGALDAPPSAHFAYQSNATESAPYILSIAQTNQGSHYAVATSSPNNAIHVVDAETLRFVRSLDGGAPLGIGSFASSKAKGGKAGQTPGGSSGTQAHEGSVSCMKSFRGVSGSEDGLISCGKEGSTVIWDLRTGASGVKMYASGMGGKARPLLSCDISLDGWTVAAGSELQGEDAVITYWDPRNPTKTLRSHTSTHSDDITVVAFAPADFALRSQNLDPDQDDTEMGSESQGAMSTHDKLLLLTASTDGLLNISDANEADEDEAVLLTANWGCSVAQAGWVGPHGVWAGSDMETFSTWTNELDPVYDFDVRDPVVQLEKNDWVSDYLITAHSSSHGTPSQPQLRVFVGSNEGDVSLISTEKPLHKSSSSPKKTSSSSQPWHLHTSWTHQHVGVVRAILCDERNGAIVTGGEDAKLNIWRDPNHGSALYGSSDVDMDMEVDDHDNEVERARRANPKKRSVGSDAEDDAMDGKRRRR